MEKIPVVILCGGKGFRLREYTDVIPKPLVTIGDIPVVIHVMKIFAYYGFTKFILALGYKGEMIKEYFADYSWKNKDFKLNILSNDNSKHNVEILEALDLENFEITFADTGTETQTGGRIKKIEKYITEENFFMTYCDNLSDVNLQNFLEFHKRNGRIASVVGVHPMSSFGVIEVENGLATSFKEKPALPGVVSGGIFIFNRKIFDYLDENSILEEDPLRKLTDEKQLAVLLHEDFWACMDTFKDVDRLNTLWQSGYLPPSNVKLGKPPCKVWD